MDECVLRLDRRRGATEAWLKGDENALRDPAQRPSDIWLINHGAGKWAAKVDPLVTSCLATAKEEATGPAEVEGSLEGMLPPYTVLRHPTGDVSRLSNAKPCQVKVNILAADSHEVFFVVRGNVLLLGEEGKYYELHEGDAIFIPEGVPHTLINVGETTARDLAAAFPSLAALAAATHDELQQVENVGPEVAQSVVSFFANPANVDVLAKLEKAGVNIRGGATEAPHGPTEFVAKKL
jgi:hypothetical protein